MAWRGRGSLLSLRPTPRGYPLRPPHSQSYFTTTTRNSSQLPYRLRYRYPPEQQQMPSMGSSQSQPDDGDNEHGNFLNQDPEPSKDSVVDENVDALGTQKKLKKRKKKRRNKDKERVDEEKEKVKRKGEGGKDVVEPVVTIVLTAPGEKPKRKKKNRQTSQEEESAQALLALNKGIPADVNTVAGNEDAMIVVDNGNSHGDPEPTDSHEEREMLEEPKRKRPRRGTRRNRISKVKVTDDEVPDSQEVDDPPPPPQPEDTPPSPPSNKAEDLHPILHYTEIQQPINDNLHEIPDSDRIISQHLAAHMSKHNPPPPPSNIPDLQDALMATDDFTGGPITADLEHDLVPLVPTPRVSGRGKATTGYKRKRLPEDDANKLVDPALRALDAAAEQEEETDDGVGDGGGEKVKRKRRLPAESVLPATPAAKKPPRTRKHPATITSTPGNSGAGAAGNGGTFTLEERHAIDTHLTQYMSLHNLTHGDLCSRVWSNDRKKDDFWESVCAVLPNRSRASIYKHVRRSYHVFQQRAKWTPEDDEELGRLVAEKGSSWKDVGDAMGRMGEDCRDRWRNYVKCGKERGRDRWGDDEEADLRKVLKVVLAGIRAGKTGRAVDGEDVDLEAEDVEGEEDVNWTSVSELMGNRRSRIQCRYKWNKMKQQRARIVGAGAAEGRGGMWRKRKVKVNVEDMKVGDKVWMLEQIRGSDAKEEKQIPWDTISEQSPLWASRDLEKSYKSLRSHLPHRRLPLNEIVSRLLANLNELPLEIRAERYQPDPLQPPVQPQQQSGYEYVQQHHTYPLPLGGHNPAPVVAMNSLTGELDTNNYTHHDSGGLDMVDPALIGQGGISSGVQQDLEKTAGEAILIAQAAAAAAQVQEAEGMKGMMDEGETEREFRRRLGV